MDIIIFSGNRPNCSSCGKPLPSWNPLIDKEECIPCIAERISDRLMEEIRKAFKKTKKIKPTNTLLWIN